MSKENARGRIFDLGAEELKKTARLILGKEAGVGRDGERHEGGRGKNGASSEWIDFPHNPFLRPSDGQDHLLGWTDDGGEGLDAKHAQVCDPAIRFVVHPDL